MRIVYLAAGAGPMYCGSCLHSNTLASALRAAGHEIVLAPVYTPLRTDEEGIAIDRLALGGINVFLKERSAPFRRMPAFMERWLDRPGLVRWATRRGTRTRPERLGSLTLSLLLGNDGPLRQEIGKLVAWLETEPRPDVIHLSTVLLAGLARPLQERFGVPVVAAIGGEDAFLEQLPRPVVEEVRSELRRRAADLSALVAMNGYYADFMAEYLAVPRSRIHVIPPGLNLQGHRPPPDARESRSGEEGTIGYLARICPEKGLHVLVDAMRLLAEENLPFRVRVAGYLDIADRPYLADLQRKVADIGLADRFQYVGELDRPAKIAFLQSLDVMSLPTIVPEGKGLSVLEAWANGTPTVLPNHGAFPEMVADTGGGLLHESSNASALAVALATMLRDRVMAARCGLQAQQAIHERYTAPRMAQQTSELYRSLCPPS